MVFRSNISPSCSTEHVVKSRSLPLALPPATRLVTNGVLGARISRASERASAKLRGGWRRLEEEEASGWWGCEWVGGGLWGWGWGWEGRVPLPAGRGKKKSILS